MFGEHNHLVSDPWSRNDHVFWISSSGSVQCLDRSGLTSQVWSPSSSSSSSTGLSYNRHLVFLSKTRAVLSDGTGRLDIIDTGDRDGDKLSWRSVFSDLVCGQQKSFVVVGGEERMEAGLVEVVVQYVEEGETGWVNILEWITFTMMEANNLMMERVRRVVTAGGVNMVSVIDGRMVVSAQKHVRIMFDSMAGEDEVTDADMEAVMEADSNSDKPGFYWRQTDQDVELWCYITDAVTKSNVSINITDGKYLEVKLSGVVHVSGELQARVEDDTWTWTLGGGKLGIMMTKQVEATWTGSLLGEDGTQGQEVTDFTEDTLMANMTTDSPIVNDNNVANTFNSEELEDCDDCEDTDRILWLGGEAPEDKLEANMTGYQHLCNITEVDSASPAIVTRHDVDGLVWRLSRDQMDHVATFPALGYVQASKTCRKFVSGSPTWNYSVICDNSRHVYIYRQPQSLAAETELRNRKSGQKVSKVAKQQVVTLDTSSDILGLAAFTSSLVLLTKDKLYTVHI